MRVLLARKEYVYYYLEYMFSNIRYVDTDNRTDEFINLARSLDLEVLAVGDFTPSSPSTKIYTIDEFANLFFEIRDREQVTDEGQEHLEEYCTLLEEFLAKK